MAANSVPAIPGQSTFIAQRPDRTQCFSWCSCCGRHGCSMRASQDHISVVARHGVCRVAHAGPFMSIASRLTHSDRQGLQADSELAHTHLTYWTHRKQTRRPIRIAHSSRYCSLHSGNCAWDIIVDSFIRWMMVAIVVMISMTWQCHIDEWF